MPGRPAIARLRDQPVALIAIVALIVVCWIVGNPRSSGPDESSHMVASAGLVRGDRTGDPNPDPNAPGTHVFEVPGMVGAPDAGCWTLTYDVPVVCANTQPLTTETKRLTSMSFNYPPWGFILPGLASFAPTAGGYAYLARLLNAAIPILLVGGSLVALLRSRRSLPVAAALLGLTPIAWFTFGVVNPSAVAIAGGLALWTGLLTDRSRLGSLLATAGWVSVLLVRRDGALWATLIVLTCCWITTTHPRHMWSSLGPRAKWIAVAVTPLPVLLPLYDGERGFNVALALAPAALVVAELLARRYATLTTDSDRKALLVYTGVGVAIGVAVAAAARPGGFHAETLRRIIANTGYHQLRQLVGVLGLLSTPVPDVAVYLFWALIGGLAVVAVLEYRRAAVIYLAALGGAIVVSWLLELGQGSEYGEYWQGRYTMPFAVGLPLVVAWRPTSSDWLADRLTTLMCGATWLISNVAFVAAQQRWGVGINGSWYPWDWDTWGAPVWPWLLVLVHAAATAALALACASTATREAAGDVQ